MSVDHNDPRVGSWYMTSAGQLIKVWAMAYFDGRRERIAIEYLNGRKRLLNRQEWSRLEVELHLYNESSRGGGAAI